MNSSHERSKRSEEIAKEWMQKKFQCLFSKGQLQVGRKSDGKPAMHNFDLVSEDCQIVAEVKSHQLTKSGKIPSGKISDTYKACLMLEKINVRQKFLILTDREFYEIFKRYSDGKISKTIEIVLPASKIVDRELRKVKAIPSLNEMENSRKKDFDTFWSELTSWLSKKKTYYELDLSQRRNR